MEYGQDIQYTLHYRNQGLELAQDVTLDITAQSGLSLTGGDHQIVTLGDIAPGAEGNLTLTGSVQGSGMEWALLTILVYDQAHPSTGQPLEWLWLDHPVDTTPPEFFGIQEPGHVITAGVNTLEGYAFDEGLFNSGVPTITLEIQPSSGGISRTLTCLDDTPNDGLWYCYWDPADDHGGLPPADGDGFNIRLQATDAFGQASGWSGWQPFVVDARPPTVTLELSVTQVISGSVVNGAFMLYGNVADDWGLGDVEACLEGDCNPADLQLETSLSERTYDDLPVAPIAIDHTTACGGGEIIRSFVVTDSFTIGEVNLGFFAEHTHRDDLVVSLESPLGTWITLLANDSITGTNFANYNLLLHDSASGVYNTLGDDNPGEPYYQRLARPYQPLSAFKGEGSTGIWTLTICDANPSTNDGLYQRSRLLLQPQDTAPRSGAWSFPVNVGNLDYVRQSVTIFGEDRLGNRTSVPLRLDVIVDTVSPVITTTQVLDRVLQTPDVTVITGTVSDGSLVSMFASIQTPLGALSMQPATQDTQAHTWKVNLAATQAGLYTLWVYAVDLAGNTSMAGPYEIQVNELQHIYLPIMYYNPPTIPAVSKWILYEDDFNNGKGWGGTIITSTAPCASTFLGEFGNQAITLTLETIQPHSQVTVSFDLYIIRSWDGNQVNWPLAASALRGYSPNAIIGPDQWLFKVDGQTILYTTFSNWDINGFRQAYPGTYPGGDYPARTAAAANNSLCYSVGSYQLDSVYHFSFTFDHVADTLVLNFAALGLQDIIDESWGLDNLQVILANSLSP